MNRLLRTTPSHIRSNDNGFSSTFYAEISNIMHGLGGQVPLEESVILMEKIIKQQLSTIISETLNYKVSDSNTIDPKDIIFLMRKNPNKILRVLKYLKELNSSKRLEHSVSNNADGEVCVKDKDNTMQLINEIREFYNLPEYFHDDEEKIRRMERADRISRMLDREQYVMYSTARQTTFCNHSMEATMARERLIKWLVPNKEVELSKLALHLLGFLLHETIARVMDAALLARHNQGIDEFTSIRPITTRELNEAIRRYTIPNIIAYSRHAIQPVSPVMFALQ